MARWKSWGALAVVAAVLVCTGTVLAQQTREGRGQRPQRNEPREGGRFDRERMNEFMMERMRAALEASEEEWTILGPRVQKVMELSRETRGGFGGGLMAFRGRRGRPGEDRLGRQGEEPAEQSAVEKATAELQQTLQNEAAATPEIRAKLTAYRKAREEARQKLAKAQEQLREVITIRQEAQLVMMGLLD